MDLYTRMNQVNEINKKSLAEYNKMSQSLVNVIIKATKDKSIDHKRIDEALKGSWFDLKDDLDKLNDEMKALPKMDPPFSKHWLFL